MVVIYQTSLTKNFMQMSNVGLEVLELVRVCESQIDYSAWESEILSSAIDKSGSQNLSSVLYVLEVIVLELTFSLLDLLISGFINSVMSVNCEKKNSWL